MNTPWLPIGTRKQGCCWSVRLSWGNVRLSTHTPAQSRVGARVVIDVGRLEVSAMARGAFNVVSSNDFPVVVACLHQAVALFVVTHSGILILMWSDPGTHRPPPASLPCQMSCAWAGDRHFFPEFHGKCSILSTGTRSQDLEAWRVPTRTVFSFKGWVFPFIVVSTLAFNAAMLRVFQNVYCFPAVQEAET